MDQKDVWSGGQPQKKAEKADDNLVGQTGESRNDQSIQGGASRDENRDFTQTKK
jgi:hypothetical protein